MMRVGGYGTSVATGRLWRIAVFTAAGAIGSASHAEAALYYWSDSDPGYYRPGPTVPPRRQKARHHHAKKIAVPEKESAKPQGPLIIAISIEKQNLRIYDANGFYAETPISTGMRGHPTPMGVFSVIQKHKLHHSNIYSNAPMPYMQRITWSGVAMHAGVLPGYPASHGCIRMPMAFAMKMWNWTRMGARVIVTPGEMTPASFSHPLLAAQKVVPQPITEPQADGFSAPKADKASAADTPRSPLGHGDGAKPDIAEPVASTPLRDKLAPSFQPRDQTHTANASGALPPTKASVTMSGAAQSNEKPDESVKAVTDISPNVPVKNEQARLPDIENAAASKPAPATVAAPKRTGQIAVFVSRKDSKLYVRQNFAPMFEVPIAIAPSDRQLGTHVFTAEVDKGDANVLHWSVISLPVPARYAERRDEDERASRRRRIAGAVEMKAVPVPDSPTEALDRLTIPADAMARITEALSTGGSIIVSDQGIAAGETGEGTDFIVSLR